MAELQQRPSPEQLGAAAADNRIYWGLVGVVALSVFGHMLAMAAWVGDYTWYEPNRHHAIVFGIALVLDVVFFGLYLLIIRHLERPPQKKARLPK